MGKRIEMLGRKFGRWTVLKEVEKRNNKRAFKCRCKCGTETVVMGDNLRSGDSTQCAQCGWEANPGREKTHGLTGTRIYNIWRGIKLRCYVPSHQSYKNYGGQGIKMCDRWKNSFESFLEDMRELPTLSHQIDRIDNSGDYKPGNCRWVLPKVQQNNKSCVTHITLNGETRSIWNWANTLNINPTTLYWRLKKGWSLERVLTVPIRKQTKTQELYPEGE